MYKDHFRLSELPFSIAPDPRFLFMSERHREALAHLMYGLAGDGGFVLLTGEVGTGKTTVCRCLLEQIPADCDVAFIMNPRLSAAEMLATVCDEFHLSYPAGSGSIKVFTDLLNAFLLRANAAGRKAVLIVDEAQNLDPEVLEQLRLLTNLETNTRKLLQIVLLGQPELLTLLQRPELRQVAQRVVARYHLSHLSRPETAAYVAHRLRVGGAQPELIPEALGGRLHRVTRGIPRLINIVCDRALLGAYVEGRPQVTARILKKASAEVLGVPQAGRRWPLAAAAAVVLVAAGALSLGLPQAVDRPGPVPESTAAPLTAQAVVVSVPPVAEAGTAHAADEKVEEPPPAEPASGADAPKPADTLAWPIAQPLEQAEGSAFHALLSRYGVDYKPLAGLSACRYAESFGLRCLAGRGDVEVLRRFNQPVILQLRGKPRPYPVLLAGLQGDIGIFIVGGEERHVAMNELLAQWTGDYQLFWRPPPAYQHPVEPGQRGPVVAWLRDAVATALAQPRGPAESASFDPALAAQVRSFQAREGLVADGVVGPLTLIRLNLALDPRLARLVSEASEKGGV
jgi:general secretion pathway protein A